jgi:hypothetical protein
VPHVCAFAQAFVTRSHKPLSSKSPLCQWTARDQRGREDATKDSGSLRQIGGGHVVPKEIKRLPAHMAGLLISGLVSKSRVGVAACCGLPHSRSPDSLPVRWMITRKKSLEDMGVGPCAKMFVCVCVCSFGRVGGWFLRKIWICAAEMITGRYFWDVPSMWY